MRLFVPGQRKRRRLVSLQRVAALAGVEVRRPSELPIVLVLVAIGAVRKLDLEERVLAFGNMTLGAFDREVFPFERISGSGMIFCRKGRRFKTIHGVAGRALRTPGPLRELAIMWIGLVAIHALRERDRLFEISTSVAERAIHRRMLALQRILGIRVIEVPTHRSQRNSFPAFGAVAGLAALRETAVVRDPRGNPSTWQMVCRCSAACRRRPLCGTFHTSLGRVIRSADSASWSDQTGPR